ncbi:hypothetical protein DUNSADRAFT_2044 [Dunaliella salina]|uniref:Encoded protein n=1 Tax=Dunaliella salina TaxID=3046 RepID=A0ABQ7GW92_DUNSA|nr:hypothetical protein DUNSADRAFT_2044 [Dunaliella salina]|eukprot:KAF5838875.1 hypothetical protein DUNSADRAFT_2044 [Dunaliella salina]
MTGSWTVLLRFNTCGFCTDGSTNRPQYLHVRLLPAPACSFKRIVRDRFREPLEGKSGGLSASLDEGFHALRVLGEQMYLNHCSSSQTTEGVQVDVTSSFDRAGMLGAGQPRYLFSYMVRIINNRDDYVQVLGRSWWVGLSYVLAHMFVCELKRLQVTGYSIEGIHS